MNTVLHVIGMEPIDVEALTIVLAAAGIGVETGKVADILARDEPVAALVAPPGEGIWDYAEARALVDAGHRVLLVGAFSKQQAQTIATLGLEYALPDSLRAVRVFAAGASARSETATAPARPLSPRERDVAVLVAGHPPLPRAAIAKELGLAPTTVKLHTEHIRRKVGAVGMGRSVLIERIRSLGLE